MLWIICNFTTDEEGSKLIMKSKSNLICNLHTSLIKDNYYIEIHIDPITSIRNKFIQEASAEKATLDKHDKNKL